MVNLVRDNGTARSAEKRDKEHTMSPFDTSILDCANRSETRRRNSAGSTLTRRRLLRDATSLAGAAFIASAVPVLGAAKTTLFYDTGAGDAADQTGLATAGQLHTFENDVNGFNTKTFFYDTGAEVVAFDTQFTPADAEKAIAFLRTKTDRPLAYAVITHPNPDKFNGLTAFQEAGAKVVASRATVEAMPEVQAYKQAYFVNAGMFTEETYPRLGTVDIIFEGAATLIFVNDQTVELRELSQPGVSSTQTVALLPKLDGLIVGDLVHHKAHAWLEGGIVDGKPTPTLDGWIADLKELADRFGGSSDTVVYGGRGLAAPLATAVADQVAYLKRADQIVTNYVAKLGERKAELSGPDAGKHYEALQKEFEAAFPDYALSYMILYGVYGLVNSKL
jgi:glyoxylase-like metal-dependent hydrolase (beta-lactamase superfamily II)